MKIIKNQKFDQERALYNLCETEVKHCVFAGQADGESALKEAGNIKITDCEFDLRYPMWHVKDFSMKDSIFSETARAPIWYAKNGDINDTKIMGIKCLRECQNVVINNSEINSPEFGWKSKNIEFNHTSINSEYFLLDCENIRLDNVKMSGKYSFQYIDDLYITNSELDTKDAFWHSKNITVENSVVKGEYLGWFSENLKLVNCRIIGTQPLCYCNNLTLINCTMEETDLAFEYSDVNAEIIGNVVSIKNPKSGMIVVDSVGEIIKDSTLMEINGTIKIREKFRKKL